ncbi:hypothetical protein MKX03_021381 [Papaver bracteatum]|nr:hypothetical protein MKX03_021381 [Papaver bracteatum]
MSYLIEVDGRLAGLRVKPGNDNIFEMDICLLHANNNRDEQDKGIIRSAVSTGRSNYWTEETISMTPLEWRSDPNYYHPSLAIRHVLGTDLFLIRFLLEKDFSLYSYDGKKKRLSDSEVKINELSSWLTGENDNIFFYDDFEFYTFSPNLSPVN